MMHGTQVSQRLEAGNRAMSAGDLLSAQGIYAETLHQDPLCFEAALNLSTLFLHTNRPQAALAMVERAVRLKPCFESYNNHGWVLAGLGKFELAEERLTRALALADDTPLKPSALHTMAMCQYQQGKWDEAIKTFDRVLAMNITEEQRVASIDQRGLALLGAGRYTEGLMDNKIRWSVLVSHPLMHSSIKQWEGQDLAGKSICVLHEQGDGDTMQFVRFVPMLRQKGARRILISVPARFHQLFRQSGLADEVIEVTDMPEVDYICPMLTVPAYFNLGPTNIPPPARLLPRSKRSGARRKKIGLVWAGKPMYAADSWRSIPLEAMLPLMNDRYDFVSLQAGERARDLHETGMIGWIENLAPFLTDWSATAQFMAGLDLVISVDTAPAHLAGSLGVPVALMVANASCWRWGDHNKTYTPWYPTMKIYRQHQQGDWSIVISKIKDRLAAGDL
jgi:hypothetical protein